MSVDCDACLGYGYMVRKEDLTDRFYELEEAEFTELDELARKLGESCGYEVVNRVDDYSDLSPYFLGIHQPDGEVIHVDNHYARRQFEPGEFAEKVSDMTRYGYLIQELYEKVMGEKPKDRPKMHLYANWW